MVTWKECREFFGQFRTRTFTTGSILPSGRALGRALTKPLRGGVGPRRILEVGPGTGAVTRHIVHCLRPEDRLDIVEINDRFAALVRGLFEEEAEFRRHAERCRVIHAPLQEVPGEGCYDYMISGLPLNNFPLGLVEEIFASYRRLLHPGGVLSYFEYAGIRGIKRRLVGASERQRLDALDAYLGEQIRRHQIGEDLVLVNVPPAIARHMRFDEEDR